MIESFHLPEEEKKILLSYFPKGIVAFDLETTGLSPVTDKIIEIAAIKIKECGKVEYYETLVNPEITIPQYTIDIHNITNDMVKDSPSLSRILSDFLSFLEGLPVVAHNAKFDMGFLIQGMYCNELSFPNIKVYDSCRLSRKVISQVKNYKLITMAEHFEIPLENQHRAMFDTYACLRIFARCLIKESKSNADIQKILNIGYLFEVTSSMEKICYDLPPFLHSLIPKLATQEVVEIKYKGGNLKNKFRPVRPISFIPLPQGIVLYAFCLTNSLNRSFLVRKIVDIRFIDKSKDQKDQSDNGSENGEDE